MILYIDNREPKNIINYLNEINNNLLKIEVKSLDIGDYILYDEKKEENLIIIERKTLSDLESSIKDGRYNEQSFRLSSMLIPNHNIYYLIEGNIMNYKNNKILYSAITSLSYFKGFSVLNTINNIGTCDMIYSICSKIIKEEHKVPYYISNKLKDYEDNKIITIKTDDTCNKEDDRLDNLDMNYCNVIKTSKKANITKENINEIMLMQIPNVSNQTAIAIVDKFKTIDNLINKLRENKECLNDIKMSSNRKITKTSIKTIIEFLL